MSLETFDERQPFQAVAQIVEADGTAIKTVVTAPVSGLRIDGITAVNTGVAAHLLQLLLNIGATDYLIAQVNLPAGSGMAGVAPVDVLGGAGAAAASGLKLANGNILKVNVTVAMGAAEAVQVFCQGGYF